MSAKDEARVGESQYFKQVLVKKKAVIKPKKCFA